MTGRRADTAFRDRVAQELRRCSFANCEATDQLTPVARWGTRYCPDHIDNARVFLNRLNSLADLHRSSAPAPDPEPSIEEPLRAQPQTEQLTLTGENA